MIRKLWCAAALAAAMQGAQAQSAFNPDISLILQGTAAYSKQNPDDYQISGFAPSGGEVAPPRRGFSLGESELVVSSNIDPYFRGQLVAALSSAHNPPDAGVQENSCRIGAAPRAPRFSVLAAQSRGPPGLL